MTKGMTVAARCLAAGMAFMAASALTPSCAADSDWIAPGRVPVLDMFNQLSLERHALRIAAMPQVEQQAKLAKEYYRKTHWGKTPDGKATLERAAEAYKMFAAQVAVINDPARPTVMWAEQVPHEWFGVKWPGSQWGADNPDNFYRYIVVDGQSRYEIHGRRSGPGPVQETFLVYANLPGTGVVNGEGAPVVASISSQDFKYEPDGSFTFTIGPEPAQPGEVHMQTKPEAKVIFIRDTLQDWNTQFPNQLRVQRVSGPAASPPRTDQQMADEAVEILKKVVPYWFNFNEDYQFKKPANKVVQGFARAGGWGFIGGGWFNLKPGEALVVTLDPLSASYFAIQTSDVWMFSSEYSKHLGGLNKAQAKPNADGTFTFVISAKDPGVWNWIDTEGTNVGTFGGRWQQLADKTQTSEKSVRGSEVVKIADLKKVLPADTAWVTPEQRKKQLEDRAASFALRFTN